MNQAEEFFDLFTGSDIAHGTFEISGVDRLTDGKKKGQARVIREQTTPAMWEEHLRGGLGLGIIPIRTDNHVRWGAIDIDSYTVNHKELVEKLRKNSIPAVVGRSKSGGAHIWMFLTEFVEAEAMQLKLGELASALAYADSEIFPKQSQILVDRGDTGNFLNMPYHNGTKNMRYAFDDAGEGLEPTEFITYAKSYQLTAEQFYELDCSFGAKSKHLPDGPPCLQHLCDQGFGEGSRNNALFNLGVYARMADETNWETLVQQYNLQHMEPPLPINEVQLVIKQVQKKDYFYRCEDQPIKPFCNKDLCRTRKFGIGNGGTTNVLSSLTKIDGDPAIWIMNVDGARVELTTLGITSQTEFQKQCVAQINKFPVTVNQRAWQQRMQTLLDSVTVVEVPPDATLEGEFKDLLIQFCTDRARGTEKEDILQGISVWMEDQVYFQVKDVKKHLSANDFKHFTSNKITLTLQQQGAQKIFWRIGGKGVHAWFLPQEFFGDSAPERTLPPVPLKKDII